MKKGIHNIIFAFFAIVVISGCRQHGQQSEAVPIITIAEEQADSSAATDTAISLEPVASVSKPACKHVGSVIGSKMVTNTIPDTITADNVMLLIDSGAVSRDVEISIVSTTEEHSGVIPAYMENLTADGAVYRMLPDGQKFDKDITIAMRYDSTALPFGYTPDDIYTFFYNEQSHMWQQVERDSVDTRNQIVYSRTNHFTDYINGVLKVPENSDVTSYTPTTIKDLKAADPMEGITLIAPPEANNQGTANLTYPLTIPAGRHGMQPQLSVTYNSAGGSGVLGLGWSLPISEISVETRWGVPLFDPLKETEAYILDGTTLVTSHIDGSGHFRLDKPTYHSSYKNRNTTFDTLRFYPRVEGAFRKIERIGRTPQSYYWIVTDKDGTRHYYGQSVQATLRDHRGNIAKWMLEKSVDTYGNTVTYSYVTKTVSIENDQPSAKQICINTIRYTGYEGSNDKGQYFVRFKYFNKIDKSSSFRYGLEEINNYILDRIEVMYRDSIVREYYFGYKTGAFGKTLLGKIFEGFDDEARNQQYTITIKDSAYLSNPHPTNVGTTMLTTIHDASPYDRCYCAFSENEQTVYYTISHEFDYYNLQGDSLFAEPVPFDANWEGEGGYVNMFNYALTEKGNIGGSTSEGFNIGGSLNFGTDYFAWLKTISAGGHYSFSRDYSDGFMMLVDIDGDGYPDKLYRDLQGRLKCRLQVPGENRFGTVRYISDVSEFQKTTTSTHNWGIEASVLGIIGGGANWSDSRSNTSVYVSDVNGDGLIDIVDNGSVYINKGNLQFEDVTDSEVIYVGGTCENEVYDFSGEVNTTIFDSGEYYVERIECKSGTDSVHMVDTVYNSDGGFMIIDNGSDFIYRDDCHSVFDTIRYTYPRRYEPDIDLVRMWKAPYSGTVRISGNARLSEELDTWRIMTRTQDGVHISIQKASDTYLAYSITLVPGMDTSIIDTISVVAGDTIYFRIGDVYKRLYDDVVWNPHIKYISATLRDNTNVTNYDVTDANGDSVYVFDYGADFMLDGTIPVSLGDTTNVLCNDTFKVELNIGLGQPLSQDIVYSLVKRSLDTNARESIAHIATLQRGVTGDHTYIDTIVLRSDSCLFLRLSPLEDGQVQWSTIETDATVTLLASSSHYIDSCRSDTNMQKTFIYHPAVDKEYYDYSVFPSNPVSGVSNKPSLNFTVTPHHTSHFNGNLYLTIKDAEYSSCYKDTIHVVNDTVCLNLSSSAFSFNSNKTYYVDCYTKDPSVSANIRNITFKFNGIGADRQAGLYSKYSSDNTKHHGTLYRGWGQFGYKQDDTSRYIKRDLTKAADFYTNSAFVPHPGDSNDINTLDTSSVISGDNPEMSVTGHYYNPLAGSFFEMKADGVHNRWVGYGNAVASSRNLCSLSGDEPEVENGDTARVDMFQSPVPVVIPGQKMKAVNKMTMNKGHGYTLLRNSHNYGNTRLLGDYMDLNGDRHPDIVSEAQIQYSKAQGGLSEKKSGYYGNINATTNSSSGYTFNGTFLNAEPESAPNPKKTHVYSKTTGQIPSVGENNSEDNTDNTFMDVNGDGLPDIVYATGEVRYNMGYGFTEPRQLSTISAIRSSTSTSSSFSAGINIANTSISGGLSIGKSDNRTTFALMDINGDGLFDELRPNSIRVNMGDGTFNTYNTESPISNLDYSHSTSFSLNASATYDALFLIVCFPVKFGVGVSGGGSASLNYTGAEFTDMNNDGFVDYIYNDDGQIKVRYSKIGKANMLKTVTNFANAEFQIDYELTTADSACPQRHWNMTTLSVYDGYDRDGVSTLYKRFDYGKRKYNRFERDDYGYDTIKTYDYENIICYNNKIPYRTNMQVYLNDNYYHNHLKVIEKVSKGNSYFETEYTYKDADILDGHFLNVEMPWCDGDGWPALAIEETHHKENSDGIIKTKREYVYGKFGNIAQVYDRGDMDDYTDDYTVNIKYDSSNVSRYIVANVSELEIPDYRKRQASYDIRGSLEVLTIDNTPSPQSIYQYDYDQYGNVITVITPATGYSSNTNYRITYEYDSQLHMLPTFVSNIEGYTSKAAYSYRWQKPTYTLDIGYNAMYYSYDSHGRTACITAPKEIESGAPYTVKYDYWYSRKFLNPDINVIDTSHGIPCYFWARTRNLDPSYPGNDINTIIFSDGLARTIQMKKDVDVLGTEMRVVGGNVHYDGLGRKVVEFFPRQEVNDSVYDTTLNNRYLIWQTQYTYDYLDRVVRTDFADGTFSTNAYAIAPDSNGINRFLNDVTDQNGHTSHIFTDPRQLNIQLVDALGHTTMFGYDAVGQLTETIDPETHTTSYSYDLGGRRIDRTHPSSGQTQWRYDAAGNMIQQTLNSGDQIQYTYDYSRPIQITHSNYPWNNVWYEYGAPNTGNQAGRLIKQQDATGVQAFHYDCMGNVDTNWHTYVLPNSPNVFTLKTAWCYDSWGRVDTIIYPDLEKVVYSYDHGGNLLHIEGMKPGQLPTTYIDTLLYDMYEQRVLQRDGNGVRTYYTYDNYNRRLKRMYNLALTGDTLQGNNYSYDLVGNIVSIIDSGYNYRTQSFAYDHCNRLLHSDGDWNRNTLNYTTHYQYSNAGRLEYKEVYSDRRNNTGDYHVNYKNNYVYNVSDNPYAVGRIDDDLGNTYQFQWDDNGNMTRVQISQPSTVRKLCWNDDNQMQGYNEHSRSDGDIAAWYNYDANGSRNIKFTSPQINMIQNAIKPSSSDIPLLYPTLYASSLITFSRYGYTKHYYEGATRICSKLGGGFGNVSTDSIQTKIIEISLNYPQQLQAQLSSLSYTFNSCLGLSYTFSDAVDLNYVIKNETERNGREYAFYYYNDHLGSAAYLTDDCGQVTQTLNYLPYGEDWVDISNNLDPRLGQYTFNGKEKDWESGFHYYGARYYWSELLTGWLSVDPMMDKYPEVSPYNYCMWNPLRLVDPDGMQAIDNDDEWKVDKQNGTITRVGLSGGNSTQYVEGDGAWIRNESRGDLLNEYKDYTVIDNTTQGEAQLNPIVERENTDAISVGAVAGTIASGVGDGSRRMSKAFYDIDNGTYMGKDGSTKPIKRGKNGGLNGRYKSQIKASAKYAKLSRVCTAVGVASALVSAKDTESQYKHGQISNTQRLTNHAVGIIGCTPVGWIAPIAYELGANYGPSTWIKN